MGASMHKMPQLKRFVHASGTIVKRFVHASGTINHQKLIQFEKNSRNINNCGSNYKLKAFAHIRFINYAFVSYFAKRKGN
jgi:precorrin isomerase